MFIAKILMLATVWTYWNHECADHLRRMSYSNSSVFTLGEWLPEWYARLHGGELVSKVSGLGVDMVYCHFFKGFGLRHERSEMEQTRDFVKKAHACGVKVLGYCQLDSLYYETMLDEVPDLEKWTARRADGSVSTYDEGKVSHYYRWSPCIESREFADYIKAVVRYGIEETGLDGFYFDNSYGRDCHCMRCQSAFREYLAAIAKNPRETCGLAHFRNVRIPPRIYQDATRSECHDSLQLWRQRFRHERLARFHAEIFGYVKSFGKDRIVMHNPAYGRNDFELRGVEVSLQPKTCDFMMAENPRFIRVGPDGRIVSQTATYKLGRRFGFKVVESSWVLSKDGTRMRPDIPRTRDAVNRFYAQGMIYGGLVGCPWLVRNAKKGDAVILDDPVQEDSARNAFGFFKEHRARLFDTVPCAKTHVLYATDTFYGWNHEAKGFHSFVDAVERLNGMAVPHDIVAEQDLESLGEGDLLVLPDLRFLSRRLYGAIASAGARGVKILQTGKAGLFDENGVERAKDDPIVGLAGVRNKTGDVPPEFRVEIDKEGIMAETQRNGTGEFVLHLLRPGNGSTLDALEVAVRFPCDPESVGLFSFEKGCRLERTEKNAQGRHVLSIRGFRTMCSIVAGGRKGGSIRRPELSGQKDTKGGCVK